MAVPKKRVSIERRRLRHSNSRKILPQVIKCDHCGKYKLPHRVCRECGMYRGNQILNVKKAKSTR